VVRTQQQSQDPHPSLLGLISLLHSFLVTTKTGQRQSCRRLRTDSPVSAIESMFLSLPLLLILAARGTRMVYPAEEDVTGDPDTEPRPCARQ